MGPRFDDFQPGAAYDILFQVKVDDWNGRQKVKLTLIDYRRI
jgi:hypothetical protein